MIEAERKLRPYLSTGVMRTDDDDDDDDDIKLKQYEVTFERVCYAFKAVPLSI